MNTFDFKSVIFDMDGTLMESLGVWAECDRKFVNGLGLEYDAALSHKMKGMHYVSACEFLRQTYCPALSFEQVSDKIMELVEYSYLNEIPLKPYAVEFVDMLSDRGIKMCVATSNDRKLAVKALKKLGIYDKMEFVLTSDQVGVGKESPEIFLAAAERMGFSPAETAVFEDSCHAVKSASEAGFYTIGVYDGRYNSDFEELKRAADLTIEDYRGLVERNGL